MRAVEMEIVIGAFSVRTWFDVGEWEGGGCRFE